jgi:hypothetical protein
MAEYGDWELTVWGCICLMANLTVANAKKA